MKQYKLPKPKVYSKIVKLTKYVCHRWQEIFRGYVC
jgi:16S rRNA A1518/A1519 N6-dimethyltransferase RsmA/KsgA/DIM1 with predicted DNA glycosylase/AP lyase activity